MNLQDYTFHLINDGKYGCCVLVGNLLITAGHLINDDGIVVRINGSQITLKKEDAIVFHENLDVDNTHQKDIAIFKIENFSSPLELDNTQVQEGMELNSLSYICKVEYQYNDINFMGGKIGTEKYELIESKAKVICLEGYYFGCETEIILEPGSSGSPIFNGNKVIGILTSGVPGQNKCVFLSSQSILELLNFLK